jgi:hypothetical protein
MTRRAIDPSRFLTSLALRLIAEQYPVPRKLDNPQRDDERRRSASQQTFGWPEKRASVIQNDA